MSILIKGMEMPKKGYKDLRIHADGSWSAYAETVPYNDIYGAVVEVPTPHGRLIDADTLKSCISERISEQIETMKKHNDEYYINTAIQMGVNACLYELNTAPTVIEAEEGEG